MLSIRNKADTIATFRHVSVQLMETLARWVPITPEMEVKTLFGRHIWDLAQHADQLGRRTVELRAALHYNRAPLRSYGAALEMLQSAVNSSERIAGVYDAALTDLERRYRAFLQSSDRLLDDPTIRIIERILADLSRMRSDRDEVLIERSNLEPARPDWLAPVQSAFGLVQEWVDYRPPQAATVEVL